MAIRTAALLSGLLFLSSSALAQNTRVSGVVRDQTGGVLPGVTVDLASGGQERTAVTGASGAYEFTGMQPGPAALTFRLLNFTVLRRTIDLTSGIETRVDPVMTLSLSADVVVTGTTTFRNIADAENPSESLVGIASAASQGAVTSRDLERRPIMRAGE